MVSVLKPKSGVVIQPARRFDPTDLVEHHDLSQPAVPGQPATLRLRPGDFRLALTHEEVILPPSLAGNIQGRSSLARAGLAVHITAPHINPAWSGRITLELYNHGPWELELFPGEDRVSQLILYRVTSRVSKAVADALSTYVRQATAFPPRTPERPLPPPTGSAVRRPPPRRPR